MVASLAAQVIRLCLSPGYRSQPDMKPVPLYLVDDASKVAQPLPHHTHSYRTYGTPTRPPVMVYLGPRNSFPVATC